MQTKPKADTRKWQAKKRIVQKESRNLWHEFYNAKKKNRDLEKKISFLIKEIDAVESKNQRTKLKKELRAANLRPSDQMIAEKLLEMKNEEMASISVNEAVYKRIAKNLANLGTVV